MGKHSRKKNGSVSVTTTPSTTSVATNPASVSQNVTTNTGTALTANTTTGTVKTATTTGSNRQHITNSSTQVVSSTTPETQAASVQQAEPKKTSDSLFSGLFGTPTVTNAPYAQTQNRKFLTNSQSQISKSIDPANKAQTENFTYAQDKSGNTYVINSQLSLQQRQDLKEQGISTSSIPFVTTGFASTPTTYPTLDAITKLRDEIKKLIIYDAGFFPTHGHRKVIAKQIEALEAQITQLKQNPLQTGQGIQGFGNEIIVDENLANQNYLYYDLSETQGEEIIDPVDTVNDGFTPNQATEATEQSVESSEVQLEANTMGTDGASTEKADERYNDGSTLTTQKDDPLIVELLADKKQKEQWMSQVNENLVALGNYHAFSNNGKNGNNGIYSNGNGKANGNGKVNGMANLGATFAKITGSKWFPIVIVGIIVLFVITLLKPKAAGIPAAPSKVFQFA